MSDLIDITRPITAVTAPWPGDTPFQLKTELRLVDGDPVNLTRITVSSHFASHVDAPYHFAQNGAKMHEVDLSVYWGPAQVVTVAKPSGPLFPVDFAAYDLTRAARLLVRTPVGTLPIDQFPEAIPHPSPELADFLGAQGIVLYGTDAPSMDALDSKDLPGHHALLRNNIMILEGLRLTAAPDGLYELVALPLHIVDGDGSPVRAVLRKKQN